MQGRIDLCKNVGGSKTPQSAGEVKILNSAVTKQRLLNKPYIIGVKNKCRQLLIALKPLFVLNVLHNSMNDI